MVARRRRRRPVGRRRHHRRRAAARARARSPARPAFSLLAVPHLARLGPLAVSTYACLFAVPLLAVWSLIADGPTLPLPDAEQAAALAYLGARRDRARLRVAGTRRSGCSAWSGPGCSRACCRSARSSVSAAARRRRGHARAAARRRRRGGRRDARRAVGRAGAAAAARGHLTCPCAPRRPRLARPLGLPHPRRPGPRLHRPLPGAGGLAARRPDPRSPTVTTTTSRPRTSSACRPSAPGWSGRPAVAERVSGQVHSIAPGELLEDELVRGVHVGAVAAYNTSKRDPDGKVVPPARRRLGGLRAQRLGRAALPLGRHRRDPRDGPRHRGRRGAAAGERHLRDDGAGGRRGRPAHPAAGGRADALGRAHRHRGRRSRLRRARRRWRCGSSSRSRPSAPAGRRRGRSAAPASSRQQPGAGHGRQLQAGAAAASADQRRRRCWRPGPRRR